MDKDIGKPWEVLRSELGPDLILFQTRYDWVRNPRNAKSLKAVILEAPDWVNIIAVTPAKKVIVVKQFRFGVAKTTVEIPAGILDKEETPEQAAVRELREETGYIASSWKYLGWFEGNVAFLNNVCHSWLALGVVKTHLRLGREVILSIEEENPLFYEAIEQFDNHFYYLFSSCRQIGVDCQNLIYYLYKCELDNKYCEQLPFMYDGEYGGYSSRLGVNRTTAQVQVYLEPYLEEVYGFREVLIYHYGREPHCYVEDCHILSHRHAAA